MMPATALGVGTMFAHSFLAHHTETRIHASYVFEPLVVTIIMMTKLLFNS